MSRLVCALLCVLLVLTPLSASAKLCVEVHDDLKAFIKKPVCDEGVVVPTLHHEQLTIAYEKLKTIKLKHKAKVDKINSDWATWQKDADKKLEVCEDDEFFCQSQKAECEKNLDDSVPITGMGGGWWLLIGVVVTAAITIPVAVVLNKE